MPRTPNFIRYPLRPRSSDFFVYQQVFVFEEYRHLAEPNSVRTIVDAGAYIGLSSLYFAAKFPHARIIALEPDPDNFRLLLHNCRHERRIIPIQAALWDHDGVVELWNRDDDAWAIRVRPTQSAVQGVAARSLLSLMRGWGIETCDLLKLDIEGAEGTVCADSEAPEWLARTRLLVIELHAHLVPGSDQSFWRLMEGQAFTVAVQGENLIFRRQGAIPTAVSQHRSA
jgi:FkbM family methyltransferase